MAFISALLLALIAPAPAVASAAPAPRVSVPADEPIVVTGQLSTRDAVKQFVKALTPTMFRGQITRFEHSVCPKVVGLPRPQSEAIEQRIRRIATAAQIIVDKEPCSADIVLIVTSDKQAFIEKLRHHNSDYLPDLWKDQIRHLEQEPGPATGWEIRGPDVNGDGIELADGSAVLAGLPDVPTNATFDQPSRLVDFVRPQFDAAVVVVERRALIGVTVTQLADYVAMRALTGANPEKLANSAAPTILHVLDVPIGGVAPITMTEWDFAFLKSFYDVNRRYHPSAQRSEITKTMTKTLEGGGGK